MGTLRDFWLRTLERVFHKQYIPYCIKIGSEKVLFMPNDILRVEASGSYSFLYTTTDKYVLSRRIHFLEKELNGWGMIRINRSHIINVCRIKRIVEGSSSYVIMDDGYKVYFPVKKREKVAKKLKEMCY